MLFVHGDYGHPFTLLHLAKIAESLGKGPVFSLHLPKGYDVKLYDAHAAAVDKVIDKIEQVVKENGGIFSGIYGVGHSKGAILLVDRQFTDQTKIAKTFSIAGRLRAFGGESLKDALERIFRNIQLYPDRPLFQVIPEADRNAPYEAMAVRPDEHCYTVPGMHLSGLFAKETSQLFGVFLD